MVHGKCKSAGCYAMTDALAEEIYGLAREALKSGQTSFAVHAYPFRMTSEKLARFKGHRWHPFWTTLKQGYDYFEANRVPPTVAVCERRYIVDVMLPATGQINPEGRCPIFQHQQLEPFAPLSGNWKVADERVTVPGPKTRDMAEVVQSAQMVSTTALGQDTGNTFATASTPTGSVPTGASALGFNQ
jgi:hypothetical protein